MNRWIDSSSCRWFAIATIILLPAFVARITTDPLFRQLPKPTSDGPVYENMAFHLFKGRGFYVDWSDDQWRSPYEQSARSAEYVSYLNAPPQSMPMTGRPPLLPVIIATIYKIVGRNETAFAIVRIMLGMCLAIACGLSIANARTALDRMYRGAKYSAFIWPIRLGCIGAIVFAASNRTLVGYANDFLTEPLALLATQLLVTLLLFVQGQPSIGKVTADSREQHLRPFLVALAISFTIAVMIFSRSLFVLWLPGIWGLLIFVWPGTMNQKLRWTTITAICTLVFLSPWWIRNCVVLGRFMPLGTQGPITLLGGYCDEALANGGDWQHAPELRLRESLRSDPHFVALPNDTQRELKVVDESRGLVRAWIKTHWREFPEMFVQRIITHWNPYFGRSLVWKLLALWGVVTIISNRRSEAWIFVGIPLMNTILVAMLYTTGGRFLVPLYGVLFTLAAIGITSLICLMNPRLILKAIGGRGSTPGL
jgi:hypothetical protein